MDELKVRRNDIVEDMKRVNTYNPSFDTVVDVLAQTLHEYKETTKKFAESGGHIIIKHTNKNGSTNIVKNPLYLALEKLRDDVIAYSRELGLTPAGLKRLNDELDSRGGTSKIGRLLQELDAQDKADTKKYKAQKKKSLDDL